MKKYLGEFDIELEDTYYKGHTEKEWALTYILMYGFIDGDFHKQWTMNQVSQILMGTPVLIKEARWEHEDGTIFKEIRFRLDEPSDEYLKWERENMDKGEDLEDFRGIAP